MAFGFFRRKKNANPRDFGRLGIRVPGRSLSRIERDIVEGHGAYEFTPVGVRSQVGQTHARRGFQNFNDEEQAAKRAYAREGIQSLQKNQEGRSVYTQFGWVDGPTAVSSSWVTEFGYWSQGEEQGVAIGFKSGKRGGREVICFYPNTDTNDYASLDSAASKGKWVHQHVINQPYLIIG